MEWSTESIEKVICFVQERPFLFDVSSAELAWTCTKIWCKKLAQKNLCKFLAQVSLLCVTAISIVVINSCYQLMQTQLLDIYTETFCRAESGISLMHRYFNLHRILSAFCRRMDHERHEAIMIGSRQHFQRFTGRLCRLFCLWSVDTRES